MNKFILLLTLSFVLLMPQVARLADPVEDKASNNKITCPNGQTKLNVPIGNNNVCVDGFGAYIQIWYNFAVGAVGIMATVIIMWAGFKWLTSRGDSSVISDAKDRINGAIIGLVLVFLSYIILSVINPDLLKIELPDLKEADIIESGMGGRQSTGGGATGSW